MLDNFVRERLNKPNTWELFKYSAKGKLDGFSVDMLFVEGCEPTIYKSGPRKGNKNFSSKINFAAYAFPSSELEKYIEDWSNATGNCPTCFGKGKVFKSWSKDLGTTEKDCKVCKGEGRVI